MSAPKRLRGRRYDIQPKLMRMRELEPEDASWVCYPNLAWPAIESKAKAALMHQNIERQWDHVSGYELADFLNDTFGSTWRRAPLYEHAVRVNRLQWLKDQIDRGHWVVLGCSECNMVEWVADAGVPWDGCWQLRWQWKSVENGSALVRHLNDVAQQRRRTRMPNRTPLSGQPFRAQFDEPKPGVLVADRSGGFWPTMGASRTRTDEDELAGASGQSGDWTAQSKTDLMAQGVANGLNAITGGGRLPPGANPGMALAGVAVREVVRRAPSDAIFNDSRDATKSPSTPTGMSGSPMDIPRGTNVPATINGVDYSAHAIDQMQGRGVPPSAVKNTIENGVVYPTREGTTGYHDPVNNMRVVTNSKTGLVVTVIPGAPGK
jgi:hypothetical protein